MLVVVIPTTPKPVTQSQLPSSTTVYSFIPSPHRDDHFYRLQSEKRSVIGERDELQRRYEALEQKHQSLQTTHDDAVSEKDEVLARLRAADRQTDTVRNDKADTFMRAEIDRLRGEL